MSRLQMIVFLHLLASISLVGCDAGRIPFPSITATVFMNGDTRPTIAVSPSPTLPFDDHLRPVGVPLLEWKGIPVMPQAIAGQEYLDGSYSYTVNASMEDVQDFYIQELAPQGWQSPDGGFQGKGVASAGIFEKDGYMIIITIQPDPDHGDGVLVILHKSR